MKDYLFPIAMLLGIFAIALFGGAKNKNSGILNSNPNYVPTPAEHQMTQSEIATQLQNTQYRADELKKQIAFEQESKTASQYKNNINFYWGGWSTDANQEYVIIDANYSNTAPIRITGWQLVSSSTGQNVTIPQSTVLYFSNSQNGLEDVWLYPGERAYIVTGKSPIGYGMRTNICSGYLSQFNTFTPSLYTSCPAPRNEDLSSIPRRPVNDNCFDLINSLPSCSIRTESLNAAYSSECQAFVANKINYQGCVNIHKNDANFYSPKSWYIYLKRSEPVWKINREVVTLYDEFGKRVQTITK